MWLKIFSTDPAWMHGGCKEFVKRSITNMFPPLLKPQRVAKLTLMAPGLEHRSAHHCPSFHTCARRDFRCGRFFAVLKAMA